MKILLPLLLFLFPWLTGLSQPKTDPFLDKLLRGQASPFLKTILDNPDSFRIQIIYTQIDRDRQNHPHFRTYRFHVDRNFYFNPASTVKLPLALLALEKLNDLKKPGLDKYASMYTDSAFKGQTRVNRDTSACDGLPSIAQYIRKIFLVSDNDAYNRLYEFIGQESINRRLWEMGYRDVRITRRFVPMDMEANRHTNPIIFKKGRDTLFVQPAAYSQLVFDQQGKILIGQGHYDWNDSLIHAPMDFSAHNNLPLEDLQQMLRSVLFSESLPAHQRFRLSADDYTFLHQYMSEYPRESHCPHYDTAEFNDSYCKFLFKADRGSIPSYMRIFNKPGWSYGFLTDMAYVVDFEHHVEFMVGATIYANSDGILNDDKYEYEQTGYPFFKELGNILYRYELARKRAHQPDLDKWRLRYQ